MALIMMEEVTDRGNEGDLKEESGNQGQLAYASFAVRVECCCLHTEANDLSEAASQTVPQF